MKKLLLVVTMLITLSSMFAQIQWDPAGIPIRQGVNIEWARSSVTLEDGGIVYVWSDTRRGARDAWIQKVDVNGNLLWGEQSEGEDWKEGILVNGEINRQEDIVVIDAGNNELIVAWVDFRHEDAGDIYAQKIGSDGSLLWDVAGVPLCLADDIQISLNIVTDDDGGAYVIWLDSRNSGGEDIYGTHITHEGSIATGWVEDGSPIVDVGGSQNQHTFWEDGQGGAIVVWHDERDPDNENLYMQRIGNDGSLLWNIDGTLVSNASNSQEKAKIKPDGNDNFYIVWRDRRNENDGDIYAQYIDINGNTLWAEDVSVFTGAGIQRNPRSTVTTDGKLVVTWEDGRNDAYYKDIYAQKIDSNGSLLWGAEGIAICTEENNQMNPRISADNNSGSWIIWDDGRTLGHPHENIYLQHINSNGEILLENNGKLVCGAEGEQFSPLVKSNSDGFLYVIWGDKRTGSTGMYTQIYNPSGEETLPDDNIIYYGLDGDARDFMILENDNNPIVIWKDTRNSSIAHQIFIQVLSENSTLLLEKNGKAITTMTGYDQEYLSATTYPGSNIIATVWEEIRGDNSQIYAQAVNLEAHSLWDSNAIAVGDFTYQQESPKITVIENNGSYDFYVGWSDFRDNWDYGIMAQKINEAGELQWNESGIVISDLSGDDTLEDIVGSCYIWKNQSWPDTNIYAKMVDENGETAEGWLDDGLIVCSDSLLLQNAKGLLVPEGIFIAWQDRRNNDQFDIYGQLVSNTGEIQWQENGVQLVSASEDQYIGNFLFDEEALIMLWEDFRNTPNTDIYIQKYDMNGNFQWTENGNVVIDRDLTQTFPYMVKNGEYYLTFWEDYYQGEESALFAQAIKTNGEYISDPGWGNDGLLICDAIKKQNKPMAVSNANGDDTYVIWEDTRSSGKTDIYNIFAQRVRTDGVSTDENTVNPVNFSLKNYPNPFNPETTISFELATKYAENTELCVYNIKGQKVKTLLNEKLEAGNHKITWNGKDKNEKIVASGIYFYKLKTGRFTSTKKMILMK
ncbi:MAG: T9SS type A sorting domain-containing protein [Candidatus Cloacimonetes bacterium]|nr:T9SS type A sorting domain-containing protein [Candidatus Cloacimonadota bacterium]